MTATRFRRLGLACVLALGAGFTAQAQTLDDLRNDQATPDNVLTYGMGYANQRYSGLAKINKGNVAKLTPLWCERSSRTASI